MGTQIIGNKFAMPYGLIAALVNRASLDPNFRVREGDVNSAPNLQKLVRKLFIPALLNAVMRTERDDENSLEKCYLKALITEDTVGIEVFDDLILLRDSCKYFDIKLPDGVLVSPPASILFSPYDDIGTYTTIPIREFHRMEHPTVKAKRFCYGVSRQAYTTSLDDLHELLQKIVQELKKGEFVTVEMSSPCEIMTLLGAAGYGSTLIPLADITPPPYNHRILLVHPHKGA